MNIHNYKLPLICELKQNFPADNTFNSQESRAEAKKHFQSLRGGPFPQYSRHPGDRDCHGPICVDPTIDIFTIAFEVLLPEKKFSTPTIDGEHKLSEEWLMSRLLL